VTLEELIRHVRGTPRQAQVIGAITGSILLGTMSSLWWGVLTQAIFICLMAAVIWIIVSFQIHADRPFAPVNRKPRP
jgi:uncharacterized membrane protein